MKKQSFITTTSGISGWFAVHMWWNDEAAQDEGFWEPYNTGFGRYPTEAQACEEAEAWAREEGLPYYARGQPLPDPSA